MPRFTKTLPTFCLHFARECDDRLNEFRYSQEVLVKFVEYVRTWR